MLLASPKAARPITAPSVRGAPAESCCPISPLSYSGPARVATTLCHPQLLLALHHCHVLPLLLVQTALGKTGGSTDSGGGGGGAASGDVLDDYDPIAAQEKEHHDMMADLGKCREEASNLHHRVMTLLARREDLEHEGEKLAYMDGIEAERDEGMRAIETVRGGRGGEAALACAQPFAGQLVQHAAAALAAACPLCSRLQTKLKVTALETALGEEDTYRATLDFMYVRAREQKVTTLSVQKAFEDSLAAHHKEFDLKQGLLARVQRAGEEEAEALRTTQTEIRKEM